MVLQITDPDHPLLRSKLEDFDFTNPPVNPGELANNLIETMTALRGLGLSANQCGLPYRVFVLWSETPLVCFNPRVVDQTSEQVMLDEGCLSFPHLFLKVKRPTMIKARFQTPTGEMKTEKFIGMTARAFLHELDHMNGILYTSRTSKIHLSRAINQQKQLTRKLKRGEAYIKPSEVPALERINVENFSTQ